MLLAAIDHGDEGSATKLKTTFDAAAVCWQIGKPPTILAARDILPEEIYLQFRKKRRKGDRFIFCIKINLSPIVHDEGVRLENSYRVSLDEDGDLVWVNEIDGEEVHYDDDPETTFGQRFMSGFISILPVDDHL